MRYVFLVVGFGVVVLLEGIGVLSKDNWSFYVAAAAVYLVFRNMKPKRKATPMSFDADDGNSFVATAEPLTPAASEPLPNHSTPEMGPQQSPSHPRLAKRWLFIGGGVVALVLIGAFMFMSRPTENEELTFVRTIDGLTVWDPDACMQASFPQFRDPELMKVVKASVLGQMRIMSANMYCSRPWEPGVFARGAKSLTDNGLLLTQWNRDTFEAAKSLMPPGSAMDGDPTEVVYGGFSEEIAAFFKVVDVSFVLLADERLYSSMRADLPKLPSWETVRGVVDKLSLDQRATRPSIKGVVYRVSKAPSILLITDLGLETSLRWALEELKDGSLTKPGQTAQAILTTSGMSGAESGAEGNFEAISVIGPLRGRLSLARAASQIESLTDLRILLFKDVATTTGLPVAYGRDAAFDPEHRRILANRSAAGEFTGATKQDLNVRMQKLLSTPLDHEFTHYLTFRPELSSNAFVQEGEATVVGEDATKSMQLAFLLPERHPLKQRLNDLVTKAQEGQDVSAAMHDLDVDIEAEKNRRTPFSRMECTWLATLQGALKEQKGDLKVFSFFTWSPRILNAQPEATIRLAYATAWAVYYYDRAAGKGWKPQLEHVAASIQHDVTLNETDKRFLDNIAGEVTGWVRRKSRTTCVAGN